MRTSAHAKRSFAEAICVKRTARGILAGGAALLALLTALPMVGCGGGSRSNSSGNAVSRQRGSFSLTVQWPDLVKSRVIPISTKSIQVTLARIAPGPSVQPVPTVPLLMPPPDTQATNRVSTTTVNNLELGTYQINVVAFPNPDATGTPVAKATVNQVVVAGTNTPLTITMNATVTRAQVSSALTTNLKIGRTRQFSVTFFDSSNAVVPVDPRAVVWSSDTPNVVTVDQNGLATMVGLGVGTVRATYKEPFTPAGQEGTGATATATVTVVDVGLATSSWPKFHGGLRSDGRTTVGAATNGVQRWRFSTTGPVVFSSPTIGPNGTIYVGAYDNNLYAINPDGSLKWTFATGDAIESSPAVTKDGTVYVGSLDGKVYAVDGQTGNEVWEYAAGGPVFGSPTVSPNGTVYVGVADPGDKVLALDALDGTLVWEKGLPAGVQTCPAFSLDNANLYVGALNGNLYALTANNGTIVWTYTADDTIYSSSPAVAPSGVIYFGTLGGQFHAVNPNGTAAAGFPVTIGIPIYSSPAVAADGTTVYFGTFDNVTGLDQHNVFAINGATGATLWTAPFTQGISSSPAVGADGTIYIGCYDGNLYGLNPDGSTKWFYQVGDNIDSSPGIGADGTVYVGGFNSKVVAVH